MDGVRDNATVATKCDDYRNNISRNLTFQRTQHIKKLTVICAV